IEDPHDLGIATVGAMLLAHHAVRWIALADQLADGRLGLAVGERDWALVRFGFDPDPAAEVALGDGAAGIGQPAGEGDEIVGYRFNHMVASRHCVSAFKGSPQRRKGAKTKGGTLACNWS